MTNVGLVEWRAGNNGMQRHSAERVDCNEIFMNVSAAWMQESTWRASKASRRHRDSAQAGCSGWQPDIDSERIGWFTGRVEGASCCLRPKKLHACAKQGRIKVGAVDWCCSIRPIQDIGPRPRTKKRKKNLLYLGCDFSGWYNFEKIIKIVATRV